ncbi:polysaccharide deacetylase family protein [Paenibacillus rhizoplanae]
MWRGAISLYSLKLPLLPFTVFRRKKKLIALTFDISWGEKKARADSEGAGRQKKVDKATFFLSSPWSKTHPEIVTSIKDAGFEIGSHGHKHVNYSTLSNDEIRTQISTAHTVLTELTGSQPNLIRMPNGDFDKKSPAGGYRSRLQSHSMGHGLTGLEEHRCG